MVLALVDASDFQGRTVNQNLINQVRNADRVAGYADFSLANHANAFNRSATGVEVWYYAGDAAAKAVAEKLSAAIAKALGLVNRGAKPTTNLYVISQSMSHMLLIEWFFIDNINDVRKWQANKTKAITAAMDVLIGYPQHRFRTTHGGHYGYNLMDPGAVGNGLKEAVVMQEVNKALLNYKAGGGTTSMYHTQGKRHYITIENQTSFYKAANFKDKKVQYVTKGAKIWVGAVKEVSKGVWMGQTDMGWMSLNKKYVK